VLALALGGGVRSGATVATTTTTLATATAAGTMTATDHGAPVVVATPLPERAHLVDRRPDRTVDAFVIAVAALLLLGVTRRTGPRGRGAAVAADATTPAGPPPATRAWHRRGPPPLLVT
jgi:hypothetical protein